jgi:hypothetical protein
MKLDDYFIKESFRICDWDLAIKTLALHFDNIEIYDAYCSGKLSLETVHDLVMFEELYLVYKNCKYTWVFGGWDRVESDTPLKECIVIWHNKVAKD